MRFQRIIEALYRQPLDITVAGFESIDAIVRPHLFGKQPNVRDDFQPGKTDLWGTPLPEMLEIDEESGLGIVGICGPLLQHASLIDKSCGACSYQDISAALEQAMESRSVRTILMNFDSPGGQHQGCIELSEKIAEIALGGEKEIYAFTECTIASAAYCLAAGCNGIFSTKSAYVGCIGSLMAFMDTSKAYEDAGMRPVVFASGKYKGAGVEGTSLSKDQAEYLMNLVNAAADQFKGHVLNFREIDSESMEGQTFYGEEAEASGLTDGVVAGIDEVEELLGQE